MAYTLVSSGVVEQGDNGVEALYGPRVVEGLRGRTSGASWTRWTAVRRSAFTARFQKHIYYLAAPADYAKYKFVFKANGGDKLTLSDILFHTEDPYAAWKNFESPEILFIDLAEDKGSKLYDVLVQDKIAYLKWQRWRFAPTSTSTTGTSMFPGEHHRVFPRTDARRGVVQGEARRPKSTSITRPTGFRNRPTSRCSS